MTDTPDSSSDTTNHEGYVLDAENAAEMEEEMQKDDFCAIDFFLTVWGYKGDTNI